MACVADALDEDLGADRTQLLPEACRLLIVQCMDTISRAAWRVVSKQACRDVYVATTRLTWQAWLERKRTHMSVVPLPLRTPLNPKVVSLPSQLLSKLTGIQHLSCSNMCDLSNIQGIPSSLRSLDLSGCCTLADLSPLQHCSMLVQLSMHALHHIPARVAESFLSIVPTLSHSLRCLTLRILDCKIPAPKSAGLILLSLAHLPRLQQLRLQLLGVSMLEQWRMGAAVIGQMTDLQLLELGLEHSPIRISAMTVMNALVPAIGKLRQLRSLQIADIPLYSRDAAAFAQVVMSLPPQLTVLGVDSSGISVTGAAALAPALHAHSATLRSVNLRRSALTPESAAALIPGFQHCTALTDLDLSGCRFGDGGATALAAVLCSVAPSLTSLNLSLNKLGTSVANRLILSPAGMKHQDMRAVGTSWPMQAPNVKK